MNDHDDFLRISFLSLVLDERFCLHTFLSAGSCLMKERCSLWITAMI